MSGQKTQQQLDHQANQNNQQKGNSGSDPANSKVHGHRSAQLENNKGKK